MTAERLGNVLAALGVVMLGLNLVCVILMLHSEAWAMAAVNAAVAVWLARSLRRWWAT